jgi:hypothetical protein
MNPLANFSLTTARTNQSLDPSEETPSPKVPGRSQQLLLILQKGMLGEASAGFDDTRI